jgi:ADP-heptose:LPS heptosyltransferase
MNILIVKLSAIGDVVHCLPLAAAIKKEFPHCHLSWLVEPAAVNLLVGNPCVDRVIEFPKKKWMAGIKESKTFFSTFGAMQKYGAELRSSKFDIAIDAQGLLKSASLCSASGASIRLGFKQARELAPLLYSHRFDAPDYYQGDRHVVDLNIALAQEAIRLLRQAGFTGGGTEEGASVGTTIGSVIPGGHTKSGDGLFFPLPDPGNESRDKIKRLLPASYGQRISALGANVIGTNRESLFKSLKGEAPLIVLLPGTTWETKIWPGASWAQLGSLLQAHFGATVVLCGGPADREKNDSIYKELRKTFLSDFKPGGNTENEVGTETEIGTEIGIGIRTGVESGADFGAETITSTGVKASGDEFRFESESESDSVREGTSGEVVATEQDATESGVGGQAAGTELGAGVEIAKTVGSMAGADAKHNEGEGMAVTINNGGVIDLTGETDLMDLVTLFGVADLVVGADTGPMHLACAVGRPYVVAVHGASPWKRNGPYGDRGHACYLDLECQPCFEKRCPLNTIACLKNLSAAKVFQEIVEFVSPTLES